MLSSNPVSRLFRLGFFWPSISSTSPHAFRKSFTWPTGSNFLCPAAKSRADASEDFKSLLQGEDIRDEQNGNPHPDDYMLFRSYYDTEFLPDLEDCICAKLEEENAAVAAAAIMPISVIYLISGIQKSAGRGRGSGSVRKQVGALLPFPIVPDHGSVESAGNSAAEADTAGDG